MSYQPVIPLTGYNGWKFLESTLDKQIENYADSASVKNDRDYFEQKMSSPITMEDFLSDTRLLRISLTAFDLGGEEWKGGFIRHVMEERADPDSTFLTRLNNTAYTNFANAFALQDGKVSLSADTIATLGDQFELASFRSAVGDVDNNMKLSLNFQAKIGELVRAESSETANLYRLLGDVPVRTVLETALNLPDDFNSLDLDLQAKILKERMLSVFSISSVSDVTKPEVVDKAIQRFHTMDMIESGQSSLSSGSVALTLLNNAAGFGATASQNLFLSILSS
ncbi:DUF1217 domain-containing protein [Hyphomonas sp.]|uniref:DUF1217 domain-containing protein n=1 Tax=Hyphomonas sp. TaxID=87 RepID=UPI0020974098|nr:DUF1217 domain-containing protein [Hyphomonas sp.]MCO7237552.1 DUF1217 domain-containing protein [Cobetia sp. Dlab-2-U]